jgi:hypothetical protein
MRELAGCTGCQALSPALPNAPGLSSRAKSRDLRLSLAMPITEPTGAAGVPCAHARGQLLYLHHGEPQPHALHRRDGRSAEKGVSAQWRECGGFTERYNCDRLAWFEAHQDVQRAIAREKQLKGWSRAKKIALIEKANPTWVDLARNWFDLEPADERRALDRMDV